MDKKLALETLKSFVENTDNVIVKDSVLTLYPELVESEDERIRKEISEYLTDVIDNICAVDEELITHQEKVFAGKIRKWITWLEKQDEQKSVDKAEPKFKIKEGKWYICISQFCNCIKGRVYKATSDSRIIDDFGTEYDMHNDAYKYFRLWTIQDAKDGDVLASDNSIFIFQEEYFAGKPVAYCGLMNGLFIEGENACWTNKKCFPATKEQREQLEKAMADAGYTFNFEKKELKKIEHNPINNQFTPEQARSKEDDIFSKAIIRDIENTQYISEDAKKDRIDWLKSLKDRYTWKPNDEQMEALRYVSNFDYGGHKATLVSLYEQLKRLED